MRLRMAAVRLFSDEYNSSRYEEGGSGPGEPHFVITPLGGRVNRAFVVGVLIYKENMGDDVEPFWKFQIQDPIGKFFISAGQYQANASAALFRIDEPSLVAVVAKSRTFTTEEGDLRTSLRAEGVYPVSFSTRDRWVLETARQSFLRLRARKAAENMDDIKEEKLIERGFPPELVQGAVLSLDYYPAVDYERFREGIIKALESVMKNEEVEPKEEEGGEDLVEEVFRIIKEETSKKEYIQIEELLRKSSPLGLDVARLDEILLKLMNENRIYEPSLGKLKTID